MIIDRMVWRTGAAAIVATMMFAFVVFRTEEWSGGFSGRASSGIANTKVIPQIAVGSFDGNRTTYSTFIQVINTGTAAVTLSGDFYNEDGSPATLQMTTTASALPAFTGAFSNLILAVSSAFVINVDTATEYTPLWGKVVSTATVAISSEFELRDGKTNALYSRVGVAASDPDMRRFVIPRLWNAAAALDTGFAIVNTGTSSATLTATLCCTATGSTVKTVSRVFMAGQKMPTFANSFFGLGTETAEAQPQFMLFDSTSPQFAATGFAVEGAKLASVPVERLR